MAEIKQKLNEMIRGGRMIPVSYTLYSHANSVNEQNRALKFQRQYDYYKRDILKISEYLKEALSVTFSQATIAKMQLPFFNIIPRIVNRIANAYMRPAERYISVEADANKVKNPAALAQANLYQDVLNASNINTRVKEAYRLAKLMDVSHVQVVWRNNRIEYDVHPSHLISVKERPDSFLDPEAVAFKRYEPDANGIDRPIYVYWDAQYNYVMNGEGYAQRQDKNAEDRNPYGLLPFVPFRLRGTESYFGEGDSELVDINEKINVLLVNGFHNAIMQSHGQAFGINLGKGANLMTGPDVMIEVNDVHDGMLAPSLEYLSPKPATTEVMAMVDWLIKTAYLQRGLPPFTASTDTKAESGAAKAIDTQELNEMREDDIENLRHIEKQLYKVTCAVWNHHNTEQLDPEAPFKVDFADNEPAISPLEYITAKEKEWALGVGSPADEYVDEDENIGVPEAQEMVKANLEFLNTLKSDYGVMQAVKNAFADQGQI